MSSRFPSTVRRLACLSLVALVPACGPESNAAEAGQAESEEPPVFPDTNRPDVRGTRAAVSSDHPLATAAGHEILLRGGNAVDAAVAMAGVLAVVRPHMNGVGGDAFALILDGQTGEVVGLNGSGRAGALATADFFADGAEDGEIPETGPLSVSVPGAVAAWADAAERFGTLPLSELLEPAIRYARDGFPVSERLYRDFEEQSGALDEVARDLYLPGAEPPPVGSLLRNPALAGTLERIAENGADGFYRGPVAEALGTFLESRGGYLRASDLAEHTSTWTEPLRGEYLGHEVLVMPPNTQGMAQLSLMGIASNFDLAAMGSNTADYLHTLIEAKKLAFADRDRWVADPAFAEVPVERLLDPAYLADRARTIDPARAADAVAPGLEGDEAVAQDERTLDDSGDTVYLTAVDADGNAVSWIQSLFHGFGSGLLEPETGVLLQNRGALYTLDPDHPNVVAPGKRPYHTLTPLMALRGGALAFTLGTPGGDSQTQSLLQIVNNLLLFDRSPQAAVEAPRFRSYGGVSVAVEDRVDPAVRAQLESRGHDLRVVHGWTATFGGAQMIRVDPESGTLVAAADPRREAYALAW